jgi:hypothetical protein
MNEVSASERKALAVIAVSRDPVQLRKFIVNARRMKSATVEREAFIRLCLVQPEASPGTVEHDVWQSVHALEEMRRDERGSTTLLSRTRQKIARDGEAKTASDLTMKKEASEGFHDLIARGHPELAFEAVVLRHPKTFDDAVIQAARSRFSGIGLDPDVFTLPEQGV